MRRFLDARVERAAGRARAKAARMGWRGVLAQRTPPMRAAAKRRSQAELGCGVGPRREVYGALAGRLTAKRRGMLSAARRGMILMDRKTWWWGNSETSNVNGSRPAFWRIGIGVKLNLETHDQVVVLLRANGEERDARSSTATRFALSR